MSQDNNLTLDQEKVETQVPAQSLSSLAWKRLKRDKVGMISLLIVCFYLLLCAAGWMGLAGENWRADVAVPNAPPTFATWEPRGTQVNTVTAPSGSADQVDDDNSAAAPDPLAALMAQADKHESQYESKTTKLKETLILGADGQGRDVLQKAIKGTSVSVSVALLGAFCAIVIGTILGAIAGYFGKWVDDVLMWFYSIFTSVPDMLLLLSFAAVLSRGISTLVLIFALTSWTYVFRLMRAEFMKHKERDYIKAADAIGAGQTRKMFRHILPNVSHILLVQFSILTVGMIKSEVVLSFLGFGVGIKQTSWGAMLAEVPAELIQGYWWQMLTVTVFMSVLVTAFSLLTDSLRDALDPKVS
ncbi:ABC transporter permease [Marinomonas spartinae]|uniref:ABC transporter permease n=1 Tax=Marinomonas spartinae TaxID=1792290 RepID=UPI0018F10EF4|nr:ABC transporter permease [Marinomonas spartinae]MBJ7555911.1 ABC transporter permease [Marinomonas spartinae]